MKNLVNYFKIFLSKVSRPAFLVFLLISVGLWYMSMLGHDYVTTIRLPMVIKNSFSSETMIVEQSQELKCRVDGNGYALLKFKMFPRKKGITVMSSQLKYEFGSDSNFVKKVSMVSLFDAVAPQLKELKLLGINNESVEVVVSPAVAKRVPIISRISVFPARGLKQIGHTDLSPDSVWLRGVKPILDTITGIYTKPKKMNNLDHNTTGMVKLNEINGVLLSLSEVKYNVNVDSFTEIEIESPIAVLGASDDLTTIVLPAKATLKMNVNSANYRHLNHNKAVLYIDLNDRQHNLTNKFKVQYSKMPEGCTEITVTPAYVDVVFETKKQSSSGLVW